MSTPQDDGRAFEKFWAQLFGARLVPGSGNKWFSKLDVTGGGMLWSLKHTRKRSMVISQDLINEIVDATVAPGGSGTLLPALGIRLAEPRFDLVIMRRDDFMTLAFDQQSHSVIIRESDVEAKRRSARTPILLREDDTANE